MSACLLLDPFQLYLEMSVVFGFSIYIQPLPTAEMLGMKMCCWDFLWGGIVIIRGRFVSNCREGENIFLFPCRKYSISTGCLPMARPFSCACTVEFIQSGTHRTGEVSNY